MASILPMTSFLSLPQATNIPECIDQKARHVFVRSRQYKVT